MKSVIITGASGFKGEALTIELLKQGYSVTAVVRDKTKLSKYSNQFPFLDIIECDMKNYNNLEKLLIHQNYEAFFHFAWAGVSGNDYFSYEKQIENIKGACDAAFVAKNLNCKNFIFAASSHQYLKTEENGIAKAASKSYYGIAKTAAQNMIYGITSDSSIHFISIFFAHVFGPKDCSKRSANIIINELLKGRAPKLIVGENLHDWLYIDDAIAALIAVLKKGIPNKAYYIGNKKIKPFKEIVMQVRDIIAPNIALFFGNYPENNFIDYSKIDLNALYNDTGFEPKCDFDESIKKTAKWVAGLNL